MGAVDHFDENGRIQDDYGNGSKKRMKKKSFYYYKKLIASNGADLENNVEFEE